MISTYSSLSLGFSSRNKFGSFSKALVPNLLSDIYPSDSFMIVGDLRF